MNLKLDSQKLEWEYPCEWGYKVIGIDQEKVRTAIEEIVGDRSSAITPSNSSKTGKYHSLSLEVGVGSEEERNEIYEALKKHPAVKMVL